MLLDGHGAASVASNLGLSNVTLLNRWKAKLLEWSGPAATPNPERTPTMRTPKPAPNIQRRESPGSCRAPTLRPESPRGERLIEG